MCTFGSGLGEGWARGATLAAVNACRIGVRRPLSIGHVGIDPAVLAQCDPAGRDRPVHGGRTTTTMAGIAPNAQCFHGFPVRPPQKLPSYTRETLPPRDSFDLAGSTLTTLRPPARQPHVRMGRARGTGADRSSGGPAPDSGTRALAFRRPGPAHPSR